MNEGTVAQQIFTDAFAVLKPGDEFSGAQLIAALTLLSQRRPEDLHPVPREKGKQQLEAHLEASLAEVRRSPVHPAEAGLMAWALGDFSFKKPLRGFPPAGNWGRVLADLCALLVDVPVRSSALGEALLQVLLDRPRFVKAFGPTPSAAAQLAGWLLDVQGDQQVLNLQSRLGQLLLQVFQLSPGALLVGLHSDTPSLSVCASLLLLEGVTNATLDYAADLAQLHTFTASAPGFDRVIAHPPVELAWGKTVQYVEEPLLEELLRALRPGGRAVAIVSSGYLYRDRPEPAVRRRLVTENWVRMVIQLPGNTKDQGGPPVILVLEQQPSDETVVFLDLTQTPQEVWLTPEVAQGLVRHPQAFLEHTWSHTGRDVGRQPKWRSVARNEITPEADLSPSRYLEQPHILHQSRLTATEGQARYETALATYQRSLQIFHQAADDLHNP